MAQIPNPNGADLVEALRQATSALSTIASAPLTRLDDESLCTLIAHAEEAARNLDTIRALTAATVDDRSRHELGKDGLSSKNGHRRPIQLLEAITGASVADLAARVRLGRATSPRQSITGEILEPLYPAVAAAMSAGAIDKNAALVIIRCLEQAKAGHPNPDDLVVAEQTLVEVATTQPVDLVTVHARVWREALDPDGVEPREEEIRERRALTLGREKHGLVPVSGMLSPACAAKLKALFSEANAPGVTPRFLPEDDATAGQDFVINDDGELVEIIRDPRTREQRQHDVLDGIITAGMRSTGTGPGEMRSTSTVMAVVHLEDLTAIEREDLAAAREAAGAGAAARTGLGLPADDTLDDTLEGIGAETSGCATTKLTADDFTTADITTPNYLPDAQVTKIKNAARYGWIDGIDEPISARTIQMMACSDGLSKIVFDKNGAVLWHGRRERYFTRAQLRALAVRDGGCVICGAPASWCDAHHVLEWKADNGLTDIDNAVLLCPAHHYWLHHSAYQMSMIDGRPHLLAPFHIDPAQTWRPVGNSRTLMTRALTLARG